MENVHENYLKLIYVAERKDGGVKPTFLAEKLGVSGAAVTDMLKKLSKDGMVKYSPYRAVTLTAKGQVLGAGMVRRHRIWELYLCQVLGFSWDEVHEEAEALEHASSDRLIDKLEAVLQYPIVDPHGDPIPDREGKMPRVGASLALSGITQGQRGIVVRVSDHDSGFLNYLNTIGLGLGDSVSVIEVREFDHSMVIEVAGVTHSLSHFAASHIFVSQDSG